ncbi:toxin-antitoxin system HicB family antitoxin [Thiorhodococcus mannitoliphagus]|uniref:Toxin-antitoxin system HicB family antitoxin n=1 Tax=Thiorhodococcus mannitoliphagus TaxID=329406 RepID=A0A6P1E4Z3_9GAMM|nr:type II toxin-antitoxin system HicB family antitoxin [Thiorhodococcus mannitoliphagus]NEX23602.1 toxin-antitoxin system HicB family antitoxin [Thiorhodococcus mannitoliphagus]
MIPRFEDFPIEIRPLTHDEGGGFLATFPDLPGCMADGETPEEAITDARGAFAAWMAAHIDDGRPVPVPGAEAAPVRFVQRLPRSVHAALKSLAASDGVSMNTMATVLIAEGIGARNHAG